MLGFAYEMEDISIRRPSQQKSGRKFQIALECGVEALGFLGFGPSSLPWREEKRRGSLSKDGRRGVESPKAPLREL